MRVSRNAALLRQSLGSAMKHHGPGHGLCQLLYAAQQLEREIKCYLKYDPNQPRVPAGSSDGGQWTAVGTGGGGSAATGAGAGGSLQPVYDGEPDEPIEAVYPIEEGVGLLVGGPGAGVFSRVFGESIVGVENLGIAQLKNLQRFEKSLPAGAKPTQIFNGKNNTKIFRANIPARNIKGSYAQYEKVIDSSGMTVKYTKTTYAPDGSIVHVKVKYP